MYIDCIIFTREKTNIDIFPKFIWILWIMNKILFNFVVSHRTENFNFLPLGLSLGLSVVTKDTGEKRSERNRRKRQFKTVIVYNTPNIYFLKENIEKCIDL